VQSVKNAWDSGESVWQKEYRYKRMDGTYAFVSDRAVILRNSKGRPHRMIGAMHDDTERRKAEDELVLSEQRFKELVQNGSDLISIMDEEGNYSFISPTIKKIMGYDPGSLMGKSAFQFIHPDDVNETRAALKRVKAEHGVQLRPFRFRNFDGQWRWIVTTLTNLLDNPAIRGIVANSRDITERKAIKEQLEYLSLLAKETVNPVTITDLGGRITWVNDAFTKLYEYSLEEIKGRKPVELLAGPDTKQADLIKIRNAAVTLVPEETEIEYYSKSGKKYIIEFQLQPVFDEAGKPMRFFELHHDITVKRNLELQLIDEQKQRHREIAKEVILAQEKERAEIGRELHDNVNQLLATVKLYLDQISSDKGKSDKLLPKSIDYLNMSIDEIRKISKQLSVSFSPDFTLEDSITDLVDSLNVAGSTSFKTNLAGLHDIGLSDLHKLSIYRIIQEQLNNILKHSRASEAFITLQRTGNELILTIRDNGAGFDVHKRKKGSGFKNIASRAAFQSGKVKISSAPGCGCTLSVSFDLARASLAERETLSGIRR
jgi:PAS domain S-box-containing protein